MTVSCRLVKTDWPSSRQDVLTGSWDSQSLTGRHAADWEDTVNCSLFVREEWMSLADTGECVSVCAEEEVDVFFRSCSLYAALVVKSSP